MIYLLLKPPMQLALWLYYRSRQLKGLEKINAGGPLLILANHTASFMDALVVAAHMKPKLYCYARGDAFGNPRFDPFLRAIGLLPVYRMSEGKENFARNDKTNEEGITILRNGGVLLIFAEGSSDTAKILKPLKKGPFRLALSATEALAEPLRVMPLGINYSDATVPGATLWIQGGEPFSVTPVPDEELPRTALALLRQTTSGLSPLVLDAGSTEKARIAQECLNSTEHTLGRALRWDEAKSITNAYKASQLPVLSQSRQSPSGVLKRVGALLLTPVGLPGLLFHGLPMGISRAIVRKKVSEPDFISAVYLTLAVILTVLWYVLCGIVLLVWKPVLLLILPVVAFSGMVWVKVNRPAWQDILSKRG